MKRMTEKEAKAQGFTVDTCCNPPIAYKGQRFNPTEHHEVLTEREEKLVEELGACIGWLEWLSGPYDDKRGLHAKHINSARKTYREVTGVEFTQT